MQSCDSAKQWRGGGEIEDAVWLNRRSEFRTTDQKRMAEAPGQILMGESTRQKRIRRELYA